MLAWQSSRSRSCQFEHSLTLTSGAISPAGRSKYGTMGINEGSFGSRGMSSISGGGRLKSGGKSMNPGGGFEKSGMGGSAPWALGGGNM